MMESGPIAYFRAKQAEREKSYKDSYNNYMKEGGATRDACYHKVKSRYKIWPSGYASAALGKCRKVGAKNWGNKSKKK